MKVFDAFPEWSQGSWQDRAPVIKAARSYAFQHEKRSRKAMLLVHGYAGYPGELVSIAEAIYEAGYDCYVPRLPGMGTSGKDFIHTRRYDWLNTVNRALNFLSENYESVSMLGHSMGCLLAVLQARVVKLEKLVLAMPAFSVPGLDKAKLKALSLVKKDIPQKWASDERYHLHYEDAPSDDAKLGAEYYSHLYPAQLYELCRLAEAADAAMDELRVPTLILASESDTVTDGRAVEKYRGKVKIVYIEGATHFVFYDIDSECERKATEAVLAFLAH